MLLEAQRGYEKYPPQLETTTHITLSTLHLIFTNWAENGKMLSSSTQRGRVTK